MSDEESAKEEAKKNIQDGFLGYSNAEVVVKLSGWDASFSKSVSQASLSALKHLILSDKNLTGALLLYSILFSFSVIFHFFETFLVRREKERLRKTNDRMDYTYT